MFINNTISFVTIAAAMSQSPLSVNNCSKNEYFGASFTDMISFVGNVAERVGARFYDDRALSVQLPPRTPRSCAHR